MMKKILVALALLLCSFGCKVTHYLPPATEQTVVHYVDSIAWHDSTIITYLEKERFVDIVKPLDTLKLETTYAKATAYLDTEYVALRGSIENKEVPVETQIKWKEKIVYKDSVLIKETPYPVEVVKQVTKYPKTYWVFLGISILFLLYIILKIYLKFKF